METIDIKEKKIKELEREFRINLNKQDAIRLSLGMDTWDEWLHREDPWTTEEEAWLTFNTPEGHELMELECEGQKIMEQITFLRTGKDPKERRREIFLELEKEHKAEMTAEKTGQ